MGAKKGYVNFQFSSNARVTEIMHNHNTGLLPIYSVQDFKALYDLYSKNGMVGGFANFNFILVTPTATYDLRITNEQQFLEFAYKYLKTEDGMKKADDKLGITKGMNEATVEKLFLKFIDTKGLTLYKASSNNLGNWGRVEKNLNNKIIIKNCHEL